LITFTEYLRRKASVKNNTAESDRSLTRAEKLKLWP